ncbi:unnamed protein product [Closterium sp. NIES-54]
MSLALYACPDDCQGSASMGSGCQLRERGRESKGECRAWVPDQPHHSPLSSSIGRRQIIPQAASPLSTTAHHLAPRLTAQQQHKPQTDLPPSLPLPPPPPHSPPPPPRPLLPPGLAPPAVTGHPGPPPPLPRHLPRQQRP